MGEGDDLSEDGYEKGGSSSASLRAGMVVPESRDGYAATTGGAYGSPEDGARSRGRKKPREAPFGSRNIASLIAERNETNSKFENSLSRTLERLGGVGQAAAGGRGAEQLPLDPIARGQLNLAAATAMSKALGEGQIEMTAAELKSRFESSFV
ncbi:unnamed protein product [Ectocarpus sp. 4 AP-2014]